MPDSYTTYQDSGVNIDAANQAVMRMRDAVRTTYTPQVLTDVGSFGGMYSIAGFMGMLEPVLVSSIDGVGTKVKIAAALNRNEVIGRDLVNHSVNDVLVQGARALFFLDYFATSRLSPPVVIDVVSGLSAACREVGCALLGGETAEMPGMYTEGEYDVAGCVVGIVERSRIVDGRQVQPGDTLVGVASSGLHTNGFSLARRVLLESETEPIALNDHVAALGKTLADELLIPHRCYANSVLPLLAEFEVKAMAHITGGGFYDNIPRVLPIDCSVTVERRSWPVPPIFALIQQRGNVPDAEMFRTFNMGIGFTLILPSDQAPALAHRLNSAGESAYIIGAVHRGVHEVDIV